MIWERCLLVTLGIMLVASPVAGRIKHFTDSKGTLHISNAEPDRQSQGTEPAGTAGPASQPEKPQTPLPSPPGIPPPAGPAGLAEPTKPNAGEESNPQQEDKGLETSSIFGEDGPGPAPDEARQLPAFGLVLLVETPFSALWSPRSI
jgi:hypothetical protein